MNPKKKGKTRKTHKQNVASRAYLHSKMYNKNVTDFRFNLFGRTVFSRRPIQWHTISPSPYPLDPRPPTPHFVMWTSTSQFAYSSQTFSEEYYWTLHDIYWTKVENSFSKQTNIKILFRYFEGRAPRQRPDTTRPLSSFHVPRKEPFFSPWRKREQKQIKSKRCSLFHLYYNKWISKQASANGFV